MFSQNDTVNQVAVMTRRLVFQISITGHATPASKVYSTTLPGVAYLRLEGLTTNNNTVDALDAGLAAVWTTANDEDTGNCVFGVFIDGSELGSIKKVLGIQLVDAQTTPTSTSLVPTKHIDNGLSVLGNIGFSVAGTGLRLDNESPLITVYVDYVLAE